MFLNRWNLRTKGEADRRGNWQSSSFTSIYADTWSHQYRANMHVDCLSWLPVLFLSGHTRLSPHLVLHPPLSCFHLFIKTHPFVVFEGSGEAHGLNEFREGPDFFLCVLGSLLHIVELTDDKPESSEGEVEWGGERGGDRKLECEE